MQILMSSDANVAEIGKSHCIEQLASVRTETYEKNTNNDSSRALPGGKYGPQAVGESWSLWNVITLSLARICKEHTP